MFLKLCAYSQFLSNILIKNPGILDLLTEPNVLDDAKKRSEVKNVLNHFLSFKIPLREAVYRLRDIEQFRIGLRNILGKCDIRTTAWELTNLAHIIIESVFEDFVKELEKEKGECKTDWAFILAGKMGGYELAFGSDIDAIFVYEEDVEISKGYYTSEFFSSVLSKTVHFLATPNEFGTLYELDLRLRPDGKKSNICKTLGGIKKYYSKKGEVWERLFLSKSRVVSSSREFGIKVNKAIKKFVFSRIKRDLLRSETVSMRKKIADAERTKHKEKTHLSFKKWYGGLLDIEFIAEYLTIVNGRKNILVRKNNTVSMIRALLRYSYMDKNDAANLEEAYKFLRNIENILRIVHNYQADTLPESDKDFRLLIQRLGMEDCDKESFFIKYNEYSFMIREIYFKYLGE
jgi:glutamate-ammonia-ligase adenylyltransferase